MTPASRVGAAGVADDAAPVFEAIEQQRAHEYVAEQIRRQIGLGIIAPGESLPPERELARMFGVGRVTIQLAIGMLESQRLITTRRGRSGGSFVLAAADSPAALDFRVVEVANSADLIAEAVEHRLVVEPAAAGQAALRRTRAELAVIKDAAARTAAAATDAEFMREDTAFHLAIARATHNRFLVAGVEETRLHLNAVLALLPDNHAEHERSVRDHDRILAAIVGADQEEATRQMAEHVSGTSAGIRTILRSVTRRRQPPAAV